jgi:LysM repeat protein
VDAANVDRRVRKIRRTGRHTTPSPVEKVAEKAGKAAPAVAIAGVLVGSVASASAAHAAVKAPATAAAAGQVRTPAGTVALVRRAQPAARSYTVRSGDSLSKIADDYYGHAADWQWIYEANRSKISNPNDIYVGERLTIPAHAPAAASTYTPKHAKTGAKVKKAVLTSSSSLSGTLGCNGLEELWEAAGGSHSEAFMAAEIAMAESGGRQYALSPTNDYGYWQINGSHGPAEATFNPMGNAKAAIAISDDGRNWGAWTTYTSGAYGGRC